jgi:hypothetical protein
MVNRPGGRRYAEENEKTFSDRFFGYLGRAVTARGSTLGGYHAVRYDPRAVGVVMDALGSDRGALVQDVVERRSVSPELGNHSIPVFNNPFGSRVNRVVNEGYELIHNEGPDFIHRNILE